MLLHHEGIAKAIEKLDPLPATANRLAELLSRADWELRDVEEAIALDQALTPRLLGLANSPLLSRGREIATVRDAVVRIGAQPVVQIAMSVGMRRRLTQSLPQYGLAEGQLWTHSVACALAAQLLAVKRRRIVPPEAFTAALLHDVGKLILARFIDDEQVGDLARARAAGTPLRVAELEILGIDHAEIGAAVIAQWKLPERLRSAVQYHHSPGDTQDVLASVVHLADVVGRRAEVATIGTLGTEGCEQVDAAALERLALDDEQVATLVDEVGEQLADVLRRYS